ncbi:imelysin family protein [Melittangium boletus]|uniref:imelysin family protein n=1 Tax=Melittangium boletus TaxID=83453 RepID=UPI003DA499C4
MTQPRISSPSARARRTMALVVTLLTALPACRESTSKPRPPTGADTVRAELLSAAGTCVLTTAREFQTRAVALEQAAQAYAAGPDASTRDAARTAYGRAMDTWQQLEVMQVGPAAPRSQPGGGDVRDNIYSWPLINRCSIEEQVVSKGYESSGFNTTLVTRRGLFVLEYLFYYEGADTACGASSPIVSSGSWAALSEAEREARKRAYAGVLATDVRARADELVRAWDAGGGDFQRTLATAGSGNAVYPSTQLGMNALSDALFYVEGIVKDQKLARPLGLRDCESSICPEALESPFARRTKANLRANLEGFRRVFEGCGTNYEGVGFDDVLTAAGSEALATKMRERLVSAQAALDAIQAPTLHEALEKDKASVRTLYDRVKSVTDVLKTELVSVLDLELPSTLEGDND